MRLRALFAAGFIALLTMSWTRPIGAQPASEGPTGNQAGDSAENVDDGGTGPEQDDDSASDEEPEGAPAAQVAAQLTGPSSVIGQLRSDQERVVGRLLEPYQDFKRSLRERYGLSFGIDYNLLFQSATASLDENIAAGGVLRFFGSWELVGRDTENTGSLVFKVENRHRLGTDVAPTQFGADIGYAGITGTSFSDAGWLLTNFYWRQHLIGNRLQFMAGIVDTTDYVDMYGLVNSWTDFSNMISSRSGSTGGDRRRTRLARNWMISSPSSSSTACRSWRTWPSRPTCSYWSIRRPIPRRT